MKRAFAFAAAAALASFSTVADAADDGKNRVVVVENISNQSLNYLYASASASCRAATASRRTSITAPTNASTTCER